LPCIAPRFGHAEHTAWLGQRIRWQADTSRGEPVVADRADIDRLDLQEESLGYRLRRDRHAYLRSRQDGPFFLAVRGDELFSDFLERPEFCHHGLRRLTAIYPKYLHRLRSWADEIEGGHLLWIQAG
jgi:hypothetical protein